MSRLDTAIRRLEGGRDCINLAVELIDGRGGLVFDLGLGNGRTYDHLRELLPRHEIYVFENDVRAHPDSTPDPDHLLIGDIRQTLPAAVARFGPGAVLIHCDIGGPDRPANDDLASFVGAQMPGLVAPGGYAMASRDIGWQGAEPVKLPPTLDPGDYFIYRAPEA